MSERINEETTSGIKNINIKTYIGKAYTHIEIVFEQEQKNPEKKKQIYTRDLNVQCFVEINKTMKKQ